MDIASGIEADDIRRAVSAVVEEDLVAAVANEGADGDEIPAGAPPAGSATQVDLPRPVETDEQRVARRFDRKSAPACGHCRRTRRPRRWPVRADRAVGAVEIRASRIVEADYGERPAGAIVEHDLISIPARERASKHDVPGRAKAAVGEVRLDFTVQIETDDVADGAGGQGARRD